jgi:hypothetical protein
MAVLVLWGNPLAAGCTHSACVSVSMCHSQHTHPVAHPACRRLAGWLSIQCAECAVWSAASVNPTTKTRLCLRGDGDPARFQ